MGPTNTDVRNEYQIKCLKRIIISDKTHRYTLVMPVHASIYKCQYCLQVKFVTKHTVEGTVFKASPDRKDVPEPTL